MPTKGGKPEPPLKERLLTHTFPSQRNCFNDASEWLMKLEVQQNEDEEITTPSSFSAFYSQHQVYTDLIKSSPTLLPLLVDSINSPSMVCHCMEIINDLVEHLNPGQTSVITGDQPVYTLGKQVQ